MMQDVDILVHPPDLSLTKVALGKSGFVQGQLDKRSMRVKPFTEQEQLECQDLHYELAPFIKLIKVPDLMPFRDCINDVIERYPLVVISEVVYFALNVDVHFNISRDIDLADLWAHSRFLDFGAGVVAAAQSPPDLLWFLASRCYHQIMLDDHPSLRLFIDVIAIVDRFGRTLDWERVLAMSKKYCLFPTLFYVLWHVREWLGPSSVPLDVIQELDPGTQGNLRYHDWGDFMP